ncbi:hypothetical protein QGN29_09895 [Temperatibacter marinus]|uniref:Secreted protein n=1 Tax=Temperatibacter marinus TaxID=1456591 RepID=A0AA52EAR1_9PROT|nr:hypothetical protein [Temperatibacter marinus]WND01862.1 hypothetical protein QGN29_09895 [Temperatibacter marinus]
MKQMTLSGFALLAFFAYGDVLADDKKKEDPVAKLKDKYTFTDTTKKCINTRLIYSTRAIDDKTILFQMRGKNKFYLNEMKYKCPRLKFEDRFKYTLRGGTNLCSYDVITVIDSFMNSFGSCGLGEFRKLEKRPKVAKAD